jgi:hypothetical protein
MFVGGTAGQVWVSNGAGGGAWTTLAGVNTDGGGVTVTAGIAAYTRTYLDYTPSFAGATSTVTDGIAYPSLGNLVFTSNADAAAYAAGGSWTYAEINTATGVELSGYAAVTPQISANGSYLIFPQIANSIALGAVNGADVVKAFNVRRDSSAFQRVDITVKNLSVNEGATGPG